MPRKKKKTEVIDETTATAVKIGALLGGDLVDDLEVERETIETAVDIMLDAGLSFIPGDVHVVKGVRLPIGKIADSFLRPLILRGIDALLDAAYPKRMELRAEAGSTVTMTVHDG